jgi:hypothetical protein
LSLGLLLRLDARRAADALRRPRLTFWIGTVLPAALLPAAAWTAGAGLRPELHTGDGRFLLGTLVSAPIAFQAYPILFRPADDPLLRRLGIAPATLYRHRALRLLMLTLGVAAVLLLPFVRAGVDIGNAAGHLALAGGVAWGAGLYFTARGAAMTIRPDRRPSGPLVSLIAWDRELAANAPLVYAPIAPVVIASFAARLAPVPGTAPLLVAAAAVFAWVGAGHFRRALPRFAPHALEMAWAPEPGDRAGELVTGRGLPGMLPRGAQLALARDRLVADRRHRWAARAMPVVGGVGALALLRSGDSPESRRWVALLAVAALASLGAVVLALGRAERGRTRWMDRALGVRVRDRLLGRGWFTFSRALAVTLPIGLAWAAVAPSAAWPWWAASAAGASLAAGFSIAAAGR